MLRVHMFSTAESVKGQGVGAAYIELIQMLKKYFPNKFAIEINNYQASDISHYHTIDPRYYASTFARKKRGVMVGAVHFLPQTLEGSIKLPRLVQSLMGRYVLSFYQRMDQLVVVNPSFIEELVALGLPREKITYIPNFVSKESFYPQDTSQKKGFRQSLNIPEDKLVVLGVGQIQKRKGIDDFVQLAIDNPEIQFVWAGGFSFGQITDGYDKYKQIYENPPANLYFPGIVDREKMNDYYNLADIFLLPSYNELFPMAILEAFSAGTAVMLRDLSLYHAIIDDYYYPCADRQAMHQALNKFQANRQALEDYKAKSLKASEYYSEPNVAKLWEQYYQRIYGQKA